jgi:chromosome segregation ATPase
MSTEQEPFRRAVLQDQDLSPEQKIQQLQKSVEHYKGEAQAAREFAELAAERLTEGFDAVGRQAQRVSELEQRVSALEERLKGYEDSEKVKGWPATRLYA